MVYTKAEIDLGPVVLNAIKNVDGHSSGLDADTLDGKHSSHFLEKEHLLDEIRYIDSDFPGFNADTLDGMHASEFMEVGQLLDEIQSIDGEASGIDADMLDGMHASDFMEVGQLLDEILAIDGEGSGIDADLVRGLPADFCSSFTANGYQKLPSGLIIQWGRFFQAGDRTTITFPIAFPDACLSISNILYAPGAGVSNERILNELSNTGATFATYGSFSISVHWMAIGH